MKKILSLMLVAVMLLACFAACDPNTPATTTTSADVATTPPATTDSGQVDESTPPPETPASTGAVKLGLTMQTLGAPYFVAQAEAFKAKCAELGIECVVLDAGADVSKQQSDVEDMISQGITALVMNPADAMGCVAIANSTMDKGIPVFIMDNSIDPSAKYISMIQSNNMAIGALVGDWLAKKFGTKEIKIGMLSGNAGNLLGVDRRIGVMKGIIETQLATNGKTSVQIVTQGWGGWGQDTGLTAAEDMIQAAPELNVIVAENDSMGLGAQIALQNAGKSDVVVVGIDGQKEALALIKDGKYGASGLNDPVKVAQTTIETVMSYLGGNKDVLKLINTEPAVITKENVDQFYKADAVF